MKTILAFCFVMLVFTDLYSQEKANISDTGKIYTYVQQMPKFPGDIMKYISDSLVYPANQREFQGAVYLTFVIEKDGTVSNVKVSRGTNGASSLDKEAIKIISEMPKWEPGLQNGEAVRVQFSLPIHFNQNDNNSSYKNTN